MAYILRKTSKKNDIYLQIYDNYWDKNLKQPRSKLYKSLGYVSALVSDDINDPIEHYTEYVKNLNEKRASDKSEETRPRAFDKSNLHNLGYFLLSVLTEELGVKEDINLLASPRQFQFSVYDMLSQLIYSRVISPCSKSKTVSSVFPLLFNSSLMSEDQVYDGLAFVGESYKKYIEIFNHCYSKYFKRDFSRAFFDCTNYYFEIDLPKDDKQKGPSKENRTDPIIGQALLLDSDLIPLAMQMYPGNESEKPYIRKVIDEMKSRYKVEGKTVQVADKGLNCARNIYAAVVESNDGYIFSKSVHGHNLSKIEKEWVLLENDTNVFTDYYDKSGILKYRLKSCIDTFKYSFKEEDPVTGKEIVRQFTTKEKRVVSFNPSLAEKQKAEIKKMADKVSSYKSYKDAAREDLGDAAKYLKIVTVDAEGKKIKPTSEINHDLIEEDLKFAGYNLMVTSELEMSESDIYSIYHNLWKIEESFRITKSFLDARPVFVQKRETIYGHFLVCYLALFLLRVLEIKCFKNKVSSYDIINFIRDFNVVDKGDDTYINISQNQFVNGKFKELTGLSCLDALYLSKKEIRNIFDNTILLESE